MPGARGGVRGVFPAGDACGVLRRDALAVVRAVVSLPALLITLVVAALAGIGRALLLRTLLGREAAALVGAARAATLLPVAPPIALLNGAGRAAARGAAPRRAGAGRARPRR